MLVVHENRGAPLQPFPDFGHSDLFARRVNHASLVERKLVRHRAQNLADHHSGYFLPLLDALDGDRLRDSLDLEQRYFPPVLIDFMNNGESGLRPLGNRLLAQGTQNQDGD